MCVDAALNPFPRTFTVALRLPDDWNAAERPVYVDNFGFTVHRDWLDGIQSERIRVCDVEELVREGRDE